MPKLVDYSGRFMFFEAASFALVRDHGVHHLTRHRIAKVLGTSISTVRRLLRAEADLRNLALTGVGRRRRRGRYGRPTGQGVDAALWLLRQVIADDPSRIAEELVWWRLSISAPTSAHLPLDRIERTMASHGPDGTPDLIVEERAERDADIAEAVTTALTVTAPGLEDQGLAEEAALLHALVDGVGIGVCLGRLAPEEGVAILRGRLADLRSGG